LAKDQRYASQAIQKHSSLVSNEKELTQVRQSYKELQFRISCLENSQKRLSALNEISSLITQSLEAEQVMSSAIHKVAEVMNTEVVLIFLVNQETKELELLAHMGVSQEFVEAVDRIKVGEGFNGGVAASGKATLVEDTSGDPRLSKEEVRREGLHAQLIVPLRFKDMVIGTLCVAVRQPRQFQPDEIELLTTIGNATGVALENARLYEEQRRLAAESEVSERNYRTLFESTSDAIWAHDLEGNITAANEAAAKLTGYEVKELVKMNVKNFLSEESLRLAREMRVKLLQGEAVQQPYDQRLTKKDGTEASLMLTTNLVVSDGQPTGFQHIARDVTEGKRVQENMRFYIQQAVRAQEEERRRISRELHDDTAQVLGSILRQLDNFIRKKHSLPADDIFFLKDLQVQLSRGLQGVHQFSQNLRPSILDDLGLLPALRSLVNEIKERDGIETDLEVLGTERRFTPEFELLVFRIVQEALSNIKRHARASKVQIMMEFAEGKTRLSVSDNGRGFELTGRVDDLPRGGKLGLAGIRERARLLGGTLEVRSSPGEGTTVIVEIPS
jgi:PAS domain S-box-containing protein